MNEMENFLKTEIHPRVGIQMKLSFESDNMPESLTPAPMKLMFYSKDGQQLVLQEETLTWISQQTKKITVVSIVGPSGSGKSFLLNKFMGKDGFVFENNLNGTTRDVWIWGMNHPSKQDEIILLMDTEGQHDVQRDDSNDVKTALISMLLSSLLILNINKKIGSDKLEHLSTLVGLAKRIHVNNEHTEVKQTLSKFLPSLLVLMRDFQSSLCWKGQRVTPDEYLEICLQPKTSESSVGLGKSGSSKQMISDIFPKEKRHCRVLPSPFRDYSKCPLQEGIPTFEAGIRDLMQDIFKIAQPKALSRNNAVTGRLFASIIKKYVQIINGGQTVSILPTYALIAEENNQRLIAEGTEKFRERMNRLKYPLDIKELFLAYHKLSKEIVDELIPKAVFDSTYEFKDNLQNQMLQIYLEMMDINEGVSRKKCEEILQILNNVITTNMDDGKYSDDDGYKKYAKDIEDLKTKYNDVPDKGIKSDAVLLKFLSNKEIEKQLIIESQCMAAHSMLKEEALRNLEEENRKLKETIEEMNREKEEHISTTIMLMDQLAILHQENEY